MKKTIYSVRFDKIDKRTREVISEGHLFFVEANDEREAAGKIIKRFSNVTTWIEIYHIVDIDSDPIDRKLYEEFIKPENQAVGSVITVAVPNNRDGDKIHWEYLPEFLSALWIALKNTFELIKLLLPVIIFILIAGKIIWELCFGK